MTRTERGFTLVELAVTIMLAGLLFAFSVPAFQSISQSHQLKGAAENVAGQLRMAREKAIATGVDQPVHFVGTNVYHIHFSSPYSIPFAWTLPRGVTYAAAMDNWYTMRKDGRCSSSGLIVLRNQRGLLDTVSVQLSGLVLTQ